MLFSGSSSFKGTSQLIGIANHLTGFRVMRVFAGMKAAWSVGILPDFWLGRFSLGARFPQILRKLQRLCVFGGKFLTGELGGVFVFCAV